MSTGEMHTQANAPWGYETEDGQWVAPVNSLTRVLTQLVEALPAGSPEHTEAASLLADVDSVRVMEAPGTYDAADSLRLHITTRTDLLARSDAAVSAMAALVD